MAKHLSFNKENSYDVSKANGAFGRRALCVLTSLYTFCFVGAPFGFGPMQRLMEGSGAYSYLCPVENDDVCPEQSHLIVNVGFLATTLSVVTPVIGHAIDHYGAAVVSYGMSLAAIVGSALLVVAPATHTSWLYWVCFTLLGLATFTGSLLSVQVGLYFQGHTQVRIIMWLNSLFDAGSVSYLFLWMIQEYFGASFVRVAFLYFLAAILLFVPSAYFWTVAVPEQDYYVVEERESLKTATEEEHPEVDHSETTSSIPDSLQLFMESKMDPSMLREVVDSRRGSLRESFRSSAGHPPTVIYGAIPENEVEEDRVLLAERTANEQLFSLPFLSLTAFISISMISCTWSLITAADFLKSLGDDGTYLKLFTLCQPASILALPLVDWIVREFGFGAAFQSVNVINFIYILIKCTSTNLHLQVITFLMVAAVRCFLYATTYSFIPSLLSADLVGRGTGFISMVGGLACFLNIPLNSLAASCGFFIPNLIYLAAVLPCTIAARNVQHIITRENDIKQSRKNGAAFSALKL